MSILKSTSTGAEMIPVTEYYLLKNGYTHDKRTNVYKRSKNNYIKMNQKKQFVYRITINRDMRNNDLLSFDVLSTDNYNDRKFYKNNVIQYDCVIDNLAELLYIHKIWREKNQRKKIKMLKELFYKKVKDNFDEYKNRMRQAKQIK